MTDTAADGREATIVRLAPDHTLELLDEVPQRARDADRYVAPDSNRAHGSRAKYVIEGCRCRPCTAANLAYNKELAARTVPTMVDAGPVRAHIEKLARQGVGFKTVARLAGVAVSSVGKVLYGVPAAGKPPSARVRRETAEKVLAVTADQAAGAQLVAATETWQLLEDLLAQGFTKGYLARQLGARTPALQLRRDTVLASTAHKVRGLHRRLSGTTPPPRRGRWAK